MHAVASPRLDRRIHRARTDPEWFCREVLGVTLWSKQAQILRAINRHPRVCVRSGHTTGKTHVAAAAALWFLLAYYPSKVITTAPTWAAVQDKTWATIRRLYAAAPVPLGGEMLTTRLRLDPQGWEAIGLSCDTPDAFQGFHEENILVIFDEAQGVPRPIWEATESMMGSANAHWLAIANPIYTQGEFWEACRNPADWHSIAISCLDHPNIAAAQAGEPVPFPAAVKLEWVERCRKRWGEGSGLYKSRVLGEFPDEGEDTVVPLALLERCAEITPAPGDGRHMGVDVARFGTDQSVALLLVDGKVQQVEEWGGMDLMATAGKIQHLRRQWDVQDENIHVDVIGVGGGVVDRLREEGVLVDPVNFAEAPAGDWSTTIGPDLPLKNRRAELYWAARCLLQQQRLSVPREFADVWAQLGWPSYKFDSGGRLQIEAKDDIKERTGQSPDHADALILALSRTGQAMIPRLLW